MPESIRECCPTPINAYHLDDCQQPVTEATRVFREAMAHPVGTVAVVEGRTAVLIGTDGGARHWQWLNGDWTAIPLGEVETFGHVRDLVIRPEAWGGGCECWVTPEHMWTTHYGAVEPGSQLEFNPECPEHGEPRSRPVPSADTEASR